MIDNPHFAYPFRIGSQSSVLEQDDPDEVVNCCLAIVKTPPGSRQDLPAFGCPDQTFNNAAGTVREIQRALSTWEPRAEFLITSEPDFFESLTSLVRVGVKGRSDA